ncbi:SMC domain protein [Cystobacter fuscus DSM 2262]|uniref:SMC domain protein n=1 Tax=Cystobacter fuscus (strain ATCC 25194 / DSM 2262 / NBRC 100088 / M29) TaxID=1242864 RepID=S9P2U8_CYSF2|nr:AAA family ATPase [Cystobacter fuscus]EPX58790.1 SMC domain protein [Cystobacter fuscus DSM 2262]
MWQRVSLSNYRSIEKADVVLAPFTVLVGANGSGKSNFADALLLATEISFDAEAAIKRRGGIASIRRWGIPNTEETSVTIRRADSRLDLDREFVEQFFSLLPDSGTEWRFGSEWIFSTKGGRGQLLVREDEDLEELVPRFGEERIGSGWMSLDGFVPTTSISLFARQSKPLTPSPSASRRLQLDLSKMRAPHLVSSSTELEEDGSNLAGVLRRLKAEGGVAFEGVLLAMRRLVPELVDLSVSEAGQFLFVEFVQRQSGGDARFGIREMSDGALRALGIIVAARTMPPGRCLIIEEPEVSVHPAAAAVLYEVLKEASARGAVLVTTHSPEFLDAARDEEILVCRYRDGLTRIGPLANAQREVLNEGLFSLSELIRSEPLRIEGEPPDVIGSPGTES